MHSVRLRYLEIAVNQVWQIDEVEHLLLVNEPFSFADHVRLFLKWHARIVEHVTCGVGPGTTPQIPVAQDELRWLSSHCFGFCSFSGGLGGRYGCDLVRFSIVLAISGGFRWRVFGLILVFYGFDRVRFLWIGT